VCDEPVERAVRPPAVEEVPSPADGDVPADDVPPSGIDLARSMLAAARREARKWGAARSGGDRGAQAASRRSGALPDDRDPQPLGRAIDRLLADRGWETPAAVGGVIGRWAQIVGAEVAAHCTPESFDDGVLRVGTDSTAWATQVRLLAPQVVRRLNEELGRGTVTRIEVHGPSGPSWRRGGRSVRGGRGPRDTYG
jgi:predicted nucleic acid-binding Zn ribbon protein